MLFFKITWSIPASLVTGRYNFLTSLNISIFLIDGTIKMLKCKENCIGIRTYNDGLLDLFCNVWSVQLCICLVCIFCFLKYFFIYTLMISRPYVANPLSEACKRIALSYEDSLWNKQTTSVFNGKSSWHLVCFFLLYFLLFCSHTCRKINTTVW